MESGSARHNLRRQIPEHDLIVTNYALLRRDLEALQKFSFRVVILDEAQFIKNPDAQITQSVKQLRADQHRTHRHKQESLAVIDSRGRQIRSMETRRVMRRTSTEGRQLAIFGLILIDG